MQEQAVLVLSSAVRSSPDDALEAILSSESFAREVSSIGPVGSNALHVAAWRNHLGIVKAILGTGQHCHVDVPDEESGWTALHRALYYGHIRIAAILMAAGASTGILDIEKRTPIDMISKHLVRSIAADSRYEAHGHVFSWGNGTNYTLGTGSQEVELAPARVDALHMHDIVQVAAAKFHSAAVTQDGKLFTWGWGRGGRLGHPEFHIHSGNSAVIQPQLVASLFSSNKRVIRVAAAKHHTLVMTSDGELFTMGSNRYGQLGYSTGNLSSQAEPRKVTSLRSHVIVRIAAANKHSVAVGSDGGVFTWGSNACGQLGYGSFDSKSSPNPRAVDALKGRHIVECAAAKRHTVVLTEDGDVLTWGHKGVSPRKVLLNGTIQAHALDGTMLRFQKGYKDVSKPEIIQICAGAAHSSVLTATGIVLTWRSADPHCQIQEIGGILSGQRIVSISAGKYRTAAVSAIGTVYMWEGRSDYNPAEDCLPGSGSKSKRGILGTSASNLVMGSSAESSTSFDGISGSSPGSFTHRSGSPSMLDRLHSRFSAGVSPSRYASSSHLHKQYYAHQHFEKIAPILVPDLRRVVDVAVGEKHSLALQQWMRSKGDYFEAGCTTCSSESHLGPSTLQVQCQETIARHMVDPYTVLQVMQYAEAAGAEMLYKRCCCVAALNLDIVITEHAHIFAEMAQNLLQDIENEISNIFGGVTAVKKNANFVFLAPVCESSLRVGCPSRAEKELGDARTCEDDSYNVLECAAINDQEDLLASEEMRKLRRLILKKMQQINALEDKASKGEKLDFQQNAKIRQKGVVLSALAALDGGVPHEEVNALIRAASQAVIESQQPRPESVPLKKPPTSTSKSKKKTRKEKPLEASMKSDVLQGENKSSVGIALLPVEQLGMSGGQKAAVTAPIHTVTIKSADSTPVKHVGFHTKVTGREASSSSSNDPRSTKTRKGGLSIFLRGDLDDTRSKPAWGSSPKPEPPTSPLFKQWFVDHKKPPLPSNSRPAGSSTATGMKSSKKQLGVKVSLKEYLQGKPSGSPEHDTPVSTAAWISKSDAVEIEPVKSLKTIQTEQEELRNAQKRISVSRSPAPYSKAVTSSEPGSSRSIATLGHSPGATCFLYGSSPQGRGKSFIASPQPTESRWYISEEVAMAAAKAKSLKDIQEEECALKHMAEIDAACQESHKNAEEIREAKKKKTKKNWRRKKKNSTSGPPL